MKIFLFFLFLLAIIYCQNQNGNNLSPNEIVNSEFYNCINEQGISGINKEINKKEDEVKDGGIKYILNSYSTNMDKKKYEDIIKECRRKALNKYKNSLKK